MIPATLHQAFRAGSFHAARGIVRISRRHVADLVVTTGTIIARDALIPMETPPFTARVPVGRRPETCVGRNAHGELVCLMTNFSVLDRPEQWP